MEEAKHSVWSNLSEGPLPEGLVLCRLCKGVCMYAEYLDFDWDGKPLVFRVGSLCDESDFLEKDDTRTLFGEMTEVIKEWNEMNGPQEASN